MNWPIFFIFSYLATAIQFGSRSLLHIGGAAPSFLLILAVYIGMAAPPMVVYWAFLILGALADLTYVLDAGDGVTDFVLVGPCALGFFCGGFAMLQLRSMVFRDSPVGLIFMVLVAGAFAHLLAVVALLAHSLVQEPLANWSAADEVVRRFFELVYTTILAVPLGMLLRRTRSLWSFEQPTHPGRMG